MISQMQSYYGFSTMPFTRDIAVGKLFRYTGHNEAAARIAHGITTRGITLVTGEVGVGKTVAARAALTLIDGPSHHLIYIPDPTVGPRGLLQHVVTALGGKPLHETGHLVPQARDFLAAEHAERGRTPVLAIDEAHMISTTGLESVRMLTNHDLDTGAPFATVLLGQPTLAAKVRLGILAALDQRITVRHHMAGMTTADTSNYIQHHLKHAGRSDTLFSTEAIHLIHSGARGKPRAVNNLGLAALLAAFADHKPIVDEASARTALTETTRDPIPTPTP